MQPFGSHLEKTYLTLPSPFYTINKPDKVVNPHMVICNYTLAESLGLKLSNEYEQSLLEACSGNLQGDITSFSQAYAGHQFGHFTLLGDGRAHVLGEYISPQGMRYDIQLKGSGRTPYSRGGDGKAALGPMLREYIISEAMAHLGVPTTRSLAVVASGEDVIRERDLPGGILTRLALSHIRVGTFEFAASQNNSDYLAALVDYVVQRHYPELMQGENKALDLIQIVIEKQIDTIVEWMRIGFIHGVMNTDNMSITGETIDYGPCAFMDTYNPNKVFSSIDHHGRYAFANQPRIAQWNLARFAETLLPLIDQNEKKAIERASTLVSQFSSRYQEKWYAMMRKKLGLSSKEEHDRKLIKDLLDWMFSQDMDYTNTFKDLTYEKNGLSGRYEQKTFIEWHKQWLSRRSKGVSDEEAITLMKRSNPVVIPRNHRVESVIDAANNGDYHLCKQLLEVLEKPYENHEKWRNYQNPPNPDEQIYQTFCGT